ncbi:MAG: hypothetical protein E3J72_05010 [Planctomycetota bacterium]|nr:MAG: hypothetical protein E3J72_05010 [Planctomycetota bacterium]
MFLRFFGKLKHIWNIEKTLRKEDEELSNRIKVAKAREKTLHAAAERDEQVADEHTKSLLELRELQNRMPRGDSFAYVKLVLLCTVFYIILFLVHPKFVELIEDICNAEFLYYIFHKSVSFWPLAFRTGWLLTTWTWLSLVALEFWPILWVAQRMLSRPNAHELLVAFIILACITFAVLIFAPIWLVSGIHITKIE